MKIAHFADIHFLNNLTKLNEQKNSLQLIYDELKKIKPNRIVLVGDSLDKCHILNETNLVASSFFNKLTEYCDYLIITKGNHEVLQKNTERPSSIETLVRLINNPKILFFDKTDFYVDKLDDSIVWSNWSWGDKFSPYINNELKENKFYIDLFHDPIFGSKNSFGKEFTESSYIKIDDFKGNLLLAGDIHQRQFFNKNNKIFGAYPSSLFQLNFGETVDKHGFLVWDIEDKNNITYKEVDIKTDYSYVNYYIKQDSFNYENIDIKIETNKNTRLKIHWNDYQSNINVENERGIRKYVKENYPNVSEIFFDRKPINKESINLDKDDQRFKTINNKETQHEIFTEFLKGKKYDDEFIVEVLKIDDVIDKRVSKIETENYQWGLETIKINNFRSYGDNIEVPLNDYDGVIQLKGNNFAGKNNFLYAILYLLYTKTPSTEKKEKNGDNRFINNRRDLDYCEVEGILNINGIRYEITKRTDRKWNKTKSEITSCSTTVEYFLLDDNNNTVDNKNEDGKSKTQKIIEQAIGDYESFIRKYYCDSYKLIDFLSSDKAVFLDNVLRDSGLDVFDLKLNEYKEWKKETYKKEEKIVLDVSTESNKIKTLNNDITNIEKEIIDANKNILDLKERIDKGTILKENEIKKLIKIDNDVLKLNLDTLKIELNQLINDKEQKHSEIGLLELNINRLKENYDVEKYNQLTKEKNEFKDWLYNKNTEKRNKESEIDTKQNLISKLNGDIIVNNKTIVSDEKSIEFEKNNIVDKITNIEKSIQIEYKNIDNKIENINNSIESEIKNIDNKIENVNKNIQIEYKNINNNISNIEKEIEILESSKTCPTCKREKDKSTIDGILATIVDKRGNITVLNQEKIDGNIIIKEYNKNIQTFQDEKLNGNDVIKECQKNIGILKLEKLNGNDLIKEHQKNIQTFQDEKLNGNNAIKQYQDNVLKYTKDIENIKISILDIKESIVLIETDIETIKKVIDDKVLYVDSITEEISKIDLDIKEIETRNKLIQEKNNIPIFIENIQLKIDNKKGEIIKYQDNFEFIDKNKKIEETITKYQSLLDSLNNDKDINSNQINALKEKINSIKKDIEIINTRIIQFTEQERRDEVHKVYQSCLSRDGVPLLLLRKLLPIINEEINNLLSEVEFNLFFDEDVNLKMINHSFPDVTQNVLDGSGSEKSFCGFCLKIVLSKISNKSKFDVLIFDEVMNTLSDASVEIFIELLQKAKNIISKIIIVEHVREVNPDYLITVQTDENKISYLTLN